MYCVSARKIRLLTLLFLCSLCTRAQPSWLYKLPKPGNQTYLYVVESASGRTELEARNQAIIRVFQSNIMRFGYRISSSEITEAVQKGKTFEDIAILHRIPVNKVCEYTEHLSRGYRCYVLCQVAKDADIRPIWNDFTKCSRIKRQNASKKKATPKDECGYVVIPSLKIMVQKEDLGQGTHYVGEQMCGSSQLGGYNDWRLPTERELMACYLNADLIGGFKTGEDVMDKKDKEKAVYWIYTRSDIFWNSKEKGINFSTGEVLNIEVQKICNIRAVRTMESKELKRFHRKRRCILELR